MFCNLTFWSYKLEICFKISFKISLLPFCGRLKVNGFSCHLSLGLLKWKCVSRYLFVGGGVQCNVEKNNGCFRHLHVLLFVSRYLLVGVVWSSKSKGAFLFWFCVSRYLFVGGGVQNQKRRFVIVFQYISLSVWCGVQNQRRLFVITSRHLRRTPISAS